MGAGAGERARRLQAEARVAAGDDRELPGEVDAAQDLVRGAVVPEARADLVLRCRHARRYELERARKQLIWRRMPTL